MPDTMARHPMRSYRISRVRAREVDQEFRYLKISAKVLNIII